MRAVEFYLFIVPDSGKIQKVKSYGVGRGCETRVKAGGLFVMCKGGARWNIFVDTIPNKGENRTVRLCWCSTASIGRDRCC